MKTTTTTKTKKTTWLNVIALSVATLFVLFALEGTQPFSAGTERAHAWHCEMMKATPQTIEAGESTTLSWKFSADSSITVTIDGMEGQVWQGTTGSVVVSPTLTTTYRAVAHKVGVDYTFECTTKVTVLPKAPSCDDITLTVDKHSFGVTGSDAKFDYVVDFCGDTSPNTVSGTLTNVMSVSFDKEIRHVRVEGDGCVLEKSRTCTPTEEKKYYVPECPFDENDTSLTIVDFNGGKERTVSTVIRSDVSSGYEITKPFSLEAGTYTVYTASWDGYLGREKVKTQPNEKWNVALRSGSTVLGTVGPTTDIKDCVTEDMQTNTFSEALTLTETAHTIAVTHAVHFDASSPNSVVPICVAFRKKPAEIVPSCEMTATPPSISEGQSTILSWNGQHIASVDIPGVGTGLRVASSTVLTPNTTTTYTGTFHTTNGKTLTCSAKVTVTEKPVIPVPACAMSISPSSVSVGGTATLTWTSNNTASGTISEGIGAVGTNGSQSVTVSKNTTYSGTWFNETGESVTCTASVSVVRSGGGGPCLNCGTTSSGGGSIREDKEPEPSIVLGKSITKTGSFITLDQVPYTGFEAGPFLTALFWISVLAISVTVAYLLTRFRPFEKIVLALNRDTANASHMHIPQRIATPHHRDVTRAQNTIVVTSVAHTDGIDVTAQIEEVAHGQNILLSPEALRIIKNKVAEEDTEVLSFLAKVFEKAKADFPREDGWILLSKERTENILGIEQSVVKKENVQTVVMGNGVPSNLGTAQFRLEKKSVRKQAEEIPTQAPRQTTQSNGTTTNNVVLKFIDNMIRLEKKETFDLLRNISSRGVDIGTFMTLVVRQLDEVYKARLEGNRTPDAELIEKTASWDTRDFETVLGILVECIDYSYSNNHIGTKIALAKAFEHFEKK